MTGANNYSQAALVIAHPSHELRVHGWLQKTRPSVFVLTDGSGRETPSRLPATTKVLADLEIKPGSVYGRVSDREVYDAFFQQDFSFFIRIAEELAEEFNRQQIEYVVGDSDEGYSPTHDACRLIIDAAVAVAKQKYQRQIANFDFAVVDIPEESSTSLNDETIWIHLEEAAFSRKIAAARAYSPKLALDVDAALLGEPFRGVRRFSEPELASDLERELTARMVRTLQSYPVLAGKIKDVMEGVELARFRTECLRPVKSPAWNKSGINEVLFYELYGEKLVAAGHYQTPIRYAEHLRPLEQAIQRHLETNANGNGLV
jgi:hypothetical protein